LSLAASSSSSSSNNNANSDVSDGDANTDTNTEDNGEEVADLSSWYDTEFLYYEYNNGVGGVYTFPGIHFIGASDVLYITYSADSKLGVTLTAVLGEQYLANTANLPMVGS